MKSILVFILGLLFGSLVSSLLVSAQENFDVKDKKVDSKYLRIFLVQRDYNLDLLHEISR